MDLETNLYRNTIFLLLKTGRSPNFRAIHYADAYFTLISVFTGQFKERVCQRGTIIVRHLSALAVVPLNDVAAAFKSIVDPPFLPCRG